MFRLLNIFRNQWILALACVACSSLNESPADALKESLDLVHAEFNDVDQATYVSLVAANGSIRRTVECGVNSEWNFDATVQSPQHVEGSTVTVDYGTQDWFIAPNCFDHTEFGHISGELFLSVRTEGDRSHAKLTGWMDTQRAERCDFELSIDFDPNSGDSSAIRGDVCGERLTTLKLPVFRHSN